MLGQILLEDDSVFIGQSFGYEGDNLSRMGEIVFNTSMSGYQEILTDPSYSHQIVAMTYPLIGNYGVNQEDLESSKVHLAGFIVREYQSNYSNFRSEQSLKDFLIEHKIPAVEGIDTRRLTRHIREKGALRGIIAIGNWDEEKLKDKVRKSPLMEGLNLVDSVTTQSQYDYPANGRKQYHVVAMDFGVKTNILRMLTERNCHVTVVPAALSSNRIMALSPDALFLSNGPGDPAAVDYAIQTISELIGKIPIFGICLGHQILALALGAKTYKLKFGHRGGNHPVQNLDTGKIEITSQNHGFVVDQSSLPSDIGVSHINLNDQTVEGIRHKNLPVFSVQYHPESSPGPHDSSYLFDQFIEMVKKTKS